MSRGDGILRGVSPGSPESTPYIASLVLGRDQSLLSTSALSPLCVGSAVHISSGLWKDPLRLGPECRIGNGPSPTPGVRRIGAYGGDPNSRDGNCHPRYRR